ncbi:MAG: hypothetical protein Q7T03_02965 [Deltaproteobacteria bacterium]|nr:hypothetical protein [Deltaproteobacteria bacterium]
MATIDFTNIPSFVSAVQMANLGETALAQTETDLSQSLFVVSSPLPLWTKLFIDTLHPIPMQPRLFAAAPGPQVGRKSVPPGFSITPILPTFEKDPGVRSQKVGLPKPDDGNTDYATREMNALFLRHKPVDVHFPKALDGEKSDILLGDLFEIHSILRGRGDIHAFWESLFQEFISGYLDMPHFSHVAAVIQTRFLPRFQDLVPEIKAEIPARILKGVILKSDARMETLFDRIQVLIGAKEEEEPWFGHAIIQAMLDPAYDFKKVGVLEVFLQRNGFDTDDFQRIILDTLLTAWQTHNAAAIQKLEQLAHDRKWDEIPDFAFKYQTRREELFSSMVQETNRGNSKALWICNAIVLFSKHPPLQKYEEQFRAIFTKELYVDPTSLNLWATFLALLEKEMKGEQYQSLIRLSFEKWLTDNLLGWMLDTPMMNKILAAVLATDKTLCAVDSDMAVYFETFQNAFEERIPQAIRRILLHPQLEKLSETWAALWAHFQMILQKPSTKPLLMLQDEAKKTVQGLFKEKDLSLLEVRLIRLHHRLEILMSKTASKDSVHEMVIATVFEAIQKNFFEGQSDDARDLFLARLSRAKDLRRLLNSSTVRKNIERVVWKGRNTGALAEPERYLGRRYMEATYLMLEYLDCTDGFGEQLPYYLHQLLKVRPVEERVAILTELNETSFPNLKKAVQAVADGWRIKIPA